jgi:hypothetical protein
MVFYGKGLHGISSATSLAGWFPMPWVQWNKRLANGGRADSLFQMQTEDIVSCWDYIPREEKTG